MAKQQNKSGFQPNNELWKLRKKPGRKTLFKSPEALWKEVIKYFKWVDENPLYELQVFHFRGTIKEHRVPKKRPYTMEGLCLFIGCSHSYFRSFKSTQQGLKHHDFIAVIEQIEETIYTQKFEGAASGFFNSNIIAASLGLKNKQEIEHKGSVLTGTLTKKERLARIKELTEKAEKVTKKS